MSTRVFTNGRVTFISPDYKRVVGPEIMPEEKRGPIASQIDQSVKTAGRPFYDEEDNVHYRVVDYLDPRNGWLLADQVMRRYSIGFGTVLQLARQGVIEPAMELGSPTKRYRVKNDELTKNVVAQMKAELQARKAPRAAKPRRVHRSW